MAEDNSDKERVHIMLFKEDWDALSILYKGKLGRSEAVRVIVHDYIARIREKANREQNRILLDDGLASDIAAGLTPRKDQPQHN